MAHRFSFNGTYIDRRYYPVGEVIQRAMTINMGLTKTTLYRDEACSAIDTDGNVFSICLGAPVAESLRVDTVSVL